MLDIIKKQTESQWHRYMVSTTMFCPNCQIVLDITTAVTIDIFKDNKPIKSYCMCKKCLTEDRKNNLETVCKKGGYSVGYITRKGRK